MDNKKKSKKELSAHLALFPKPTPNELGGPRDPQPHIHTVRPHQSPRPHPQHPQKHVRRAGEPAEKHAHVHRLPVQLRVSRDTRYERLRDAIEREQRDVITIRSERIAGARIGPARARDNPEQQRRERGPERAGGQRDEGVQVQDRLQDDARLPDAGLVALLRGRVRRAELGEEVAAALLDGLEEHARDQAAVVGGEGVGALVAEGGERGDEDGVALREDIFDAGLEEKGETEVDERAWEPVDDIFLWVAATLLTLSQEIWMIAVDYFFFNVCGSRENFSFLATGVTRQA